MVKTKKRIALTILLTMAVLLLFCTCCFINNTSASAATKGDTSDVAEPYGLITQISLTLGTNSDSVWAKARNDFTLGNSTVEVYIYLYSSLESQEDTRNMTLENTAYIGDLNINKSLEISAPINGEQRYWRARVEYRMDNKDWKSKETATHLIDANGKVI
ncbi:MAG: hypothetical protein K2J13_03005 [Clostridia bacterium]|nr:hypothetical protein [Clostridia bacterium]